MKKSCAFLACHIAESCCLAGGCVQPRFGAAALAAGDGLRKDAPALNGTKPRAMRDPWWTPRRRKKIAR